MSKGFTFAVKMPSIHIRSTLWCIFMVSSAFALVKATQTTSAESCLKDLNNALNQQADNYKALKSTIKDLLSSASVHVKETVLSNKEELESDLNQTTTSFHIDNVSCHYNGSQFENILLELDNFVTDLTTKLEMHDTDLDDFQINDLKDKFVECSGDQKCASDVLNRCQTRTSHLSTWGTFFGDLGNIMEANIAYKSLEYQAEANETYSVIKGCLIDAIVNQEEKVVTKLQKKIDDYVEEIDGLVLSEAYDEDYFTFNQIDDLREVIMEIKDALEEEKKTAREIGCQLGAPLNKVFDYFCDTIQATSKNDFSAREKIFNEAKSKFGDHKLKLREQMIKLKECKDLNCLETLVDLDLMNFNASLKVVEDLATGFKDSITDVLKDTKLAVETLLKNSTAHVSEQILFQQCVDVINKNITEAQQRIQVEAISINSSSEFYVNHLREAIFKKVENLDSVINNTVQNVTNLDDNLQFGCSTPEALKNVSMYRNQWLQNAEALITHFNETLEDKIQQILSNCSSALKQQIIAMGNCPTSSYKCLKGIVDESTNIEIKLRRNFDKFQYFAATSCVDSNKNLDDPTQACAKMLHPTLICLYKSSGVAVRAFGLLSSGFLVILSILL